MRSVLTILLLLALITPAWAQMGQPIPGTLPLAESAEVLLHLRQAEQSMDRFEIDGLKTTLQAAQDQVEAARKLGASGLRFKGTRARLTLLQKDFQEALKLGRQLIREVPDDLGTYALLADAFLGLGDYRRAETEVQWMLDLRPTDPRGLVRAARLRRLFGDMEGALDLAGQAYRAYGPQETSERVLALDLIAMLLIEKGLFEEAERIVAGLPRLAPESALASDREAHLRLSQNRPEAAIPLLKRAQQISPSPGRLYHLAKALEATGQSARAAETFQLFQRSAEPLVESLDNANVELTYLLADRVDPAAAVVLARAEMGRRPDLERQAALAWALFKNGQVAAARAELQRALQVGSVAPQFQQQLKAMTAVTSSP